MKIYVYTPYGYSKKYKKFYSNSNNFKQPLTKKIFFKGIKIKFVI